MLSQTHNQLIKEMNTGTISNSECACVQYSIVSLTLTETVSEQAAVI